MFPGVDGFHWTFGHIFFISIFLAVASALASVVIASLVRARRDVAAGQAEPIRWRADFADLPAAFRQCRHALTGEAPGRVCSNAFDCRICSNHPKFKSFRTGEGADTIAGLRYPNHRYYHRGHTWVAPQPDGSLLVGLDAISQRMLGALDTVKFPAIGSHLASSGPGWRMRKNGLDVRVLSPVDGIVLATGSPDDDWYLRVHPATQPPDLRHLLRGEEVSAWVNRELEHLQLALGNTACLADGGVLMDEFIREVPEPQRDALLGQVFLEP